MYVKGSAENLLAKYDHHLLPYLLRHNFFDAENTEGTKGLLKDNFSYRHSLKEHLSKEYSSKEMRDILHLNRE